MKLQLCKSCKRVHQSGTAVTGDALLLALKTYPTVIGAGKCSDCKSRRDAYMQQIKREANPDEGLGS